MAVTIAFVTHGASTDNDAGCMSGHNDVNLSVLGEAQARELGRRMAGKDFVAILCSDLRRSYRTSLLAFGEAVSIDRDSRLRECDYSDLSGQPGSRVSTAKLRHIDTPFPGGESYRQELARMRSFLDSLANGHDGREVPIVSHRATQYGLEYWLPGVPLETLLLAAWQWQPSWVYHLGKLGPE